jgi:hypothetical protein
MRHFTSTLVITASMMLVFVAGAQQPTHKPRTPHLAQQRLLRNSSSRAGS